MGLVLGHAYTIVILDSLRSKFLIDLANSSKSATHGVKESGWALRQTTTRNFGIKYLVWTKSDSATLRMMTVCSL